LAFFDSFGVGQAKELRAELRALFDVDDARERRVIWGSIG
jgi:hypothetical protein